MERSRRGQRDHAHHGAVPVRAGGAFAFLVQWVVFLPSFLAQTEHYCDLTGGLTYLALTTGVLLLAGNWLLNGVGNDAARERLIVHFEPVEDARMASLRARFDIVLT